MLEQPVSVAGGLEAGAHDEAAEGEVLHLGDDGQRPAQPVKGRHQAAHPHQGLGPHHPALRVDVQDVHQVELDGVHLGPLLLLPLGRADLTHPLAIAATLVVPHLPLDAEHLLLVFLWGGIYLEHNLSPEQIRQRMLSTV